MRRRRKERWRKLSQRTIVLPLLPSTRSPLDHHDDDDYDDDDDGPLRLTRSSLADDFMIDDATPIEWCEWHMDHDNFVG